MIIRLVECTAIPAALAQAVEANSLYLLIVNFFNTWCYNSQRKICQFEIFHLIATKNMYLPHSIQN